MVVLNQFEQDLLRVWEQNCYENYKRDGEGASTPSELAARLNRIGYTVEAHTVAWQMGRLRKKLETSPGTDAG